MIARFAILAALACSCSAQVLINSAGATFPYPIYSRWFDAFYRVHPDAQINYQSVGSGFAIRQLEAGVLDFGATDRPLSDAEIARAPAAVLHFPTVVGAVVPVYHVPGVNRELNFTAQALAGILFGHIHYWDDPIIAAANARVRLPHAEIVVVHRSEASGTTYILTDYLAKTGAEKDLRSPTTTPQWRTGIRARGNEGVVGMIRQTPFSIGYAELIYAAQNQVRYGRVQNSTGRFVRADGQSIRAAAESSRAAMPGDLRISIANAPGDNAYPIASYTWLLVPAAIPNTDKRQTLTTFLRWMLTEGQSMVLDLGYVPLPKDVATKALKLCDRIR